MQEAERILATSEDGRVRAAGVQDSATDLKDQLAKIDEILKGAESKVDQDADELDTVSRCEKYLNKNVDMFLIQLCGIKYLLILLLFKVKTLKTFF